MRRASSRWILSWFVLIVMMLLFSSVMVMTIEVDLHGSYPDFSLAIVSFLFFQKQGLQNPENRPSRALSLVLLDVSTFPQR